MISSSVLVVQAQKTSLSDEKAPAKDQMKTFEKKSETVFTEEQLIILEKQGINQDMLMDKESQMKAEEILMTGGLINPFSLNKEGYQTDAASAYAFSQSTGTYTPITGGTVVANSIPGSGTTYLDDVSFSLQPIPFTFIFNGASYTDFTINTNGFISFGTTIPAGATYSPISSTTAFAGCATAFARDSDGRFLLQAATTAGSNILTAVTKFGGVIVGEEITATNIPAGTTITGFDIGAATITLSANATATGAAQTCVVYSAEIRTETLGTAPNRIHVIQFKNFKRYGSGTYFGELYNCQIRLYETTNVVEVMYGNYIGFTTSTTGQVGLRGATNADYKNRTTTTDWSATTAGATNAATCTLSATVYPASGLTFIYTPPLTPGDPYGPSPANLATGIAITTNLGWTFGANTDNYDLFFDVVNPPLTKVVDNGVATNPGSYDPPADLNYLTPYYWQVIAKNASGNTNGAVWSFTTASNLPYAPTLPNPASGTLGVDVNTDVSWTFGLNTETYDVYFDVVNPPLAKVVDNAAVGGSTGSYDPGTMNYSTPYYWQVIARNAVKAETPGPVWNFTTACGSITTLPWSEGFESVTIPALPTCWLEENGDWVTTNNASSTYDADAYSGAQFLRESWSATNEYVWTPGFSLTSGTSYDFSFWWAGDNYSGWTGDIFYNTIQNSAGATQMGASFVVDATVTTKIYEQVTRTIVPSVTGTFYFSIRVNCPTSTPWYLSFDEFRLETTPECPNPQALGATNITANSADLTWTSLSGLSDVEFGLENFVPTGVPTDAGVTSPLPKASLLSSTGYDFYVRDNCGGGLYSNWVGPYTFYTACGAFATPFFEPFQNTTIPLCWEMSGPQAWLFTTTWPGYGATGLTDHTGTGGSFAGVDGSGTTLLTGITLLSPYIDVTALTVPQLRFFLFNNNINDASYQTLTVDLWDGSAWNPAIYFWGPTNNDPAWVEVSVVLSTFTITGDIQFRFVVDKSGGSPFYDDLIIDDVYVEEAPTCPNPAGLGATNITTAQADLTWTSYSGLSDIEFGTAGFVPTGTPTDPGVTSPYTKGGLSASSSYDFYVRDDCGGGDYSNWVGPYNFDTPCAPFIAPYTQDFTTWPPLCWDLTGGTYSWIQYTTGVQCAEASFWGQTSGNTDIMTTNTIDVSGLSNPSLEFYWSHLYSATYPLDALEVLVSDDNGGSWTQVWYKIGTDLNSNDGAGNTTPGSFVSSGIINLTAFGNNLLIQFYGHSGYGPDCFVDNVSVFNAAYGTLEGYVYKYGTTTPIENASVVIGTNSGLSGIGGFYSIPAVLVGTYNVDCNATGYNGATATGVVISDGITTTQDFYLQWAEIAVNPGLFNEFMAPESLLDKTLTITNNAPAALNYSSNLEFLTDGLENNKAAGDILLDLNIEAATLDVGNLGAEFDGVYYYVSGSHGGVAPFKLYKLDQTGALIATYDQPAQATTVWGMRDLAYNAGYIYGGSEDGFYRFDIATGTFTTLFTGNLGISCIRALAYYPPTGNFLAVNWTGAITEFNTAGTVIGTYTAPAGLTAIYGMAWDSWNNKLWLFDQSGTPGTTFFEYDILTQALTGVSYQVPLFTGLTAQISGGAFFSLTAATGKAVLGGLVQGTDASALSQDHVFLMELNVTETWLSITANGSGTVPGTAKGFVDVTVHFDATGLVAGTVKTANIVISSNALNAPTVTIPVTMNVVAGYTVSGNVYYGTTGTTKPMATNTTVTLNPHGSTSTGAAGYYEFLYVTDGSYKLSGSTTKIDGGLQAFDATLIARYLGSIVAFSNLQKRAADVNLSNTVTSFDGTLLKRKLGGIATPQWTAPAYVFDGPFPTTPVLDGMPVTVSGADVTQELRTLCSGDLNSSYTPPAE